MVLTNPELGYPQDRRLGGGGGGGGGGGVPWVPRNPPACHGLVPATLL